MVKYESECVSCGLPCLYEQCRYYRVERHYCDECNDAAVVKIDGEDFCRECANEKLNEWFDDLSIKEKCKVLDVPYEEVE